MFGVTGWTSNSSTKTTIRNMGEGSIPIFSYHWSPTDIWQTNMMPVRGGAEATGLDIDEVDDEFVYDREYSEAEL